MSSRPEAAAIARGARGAIAWAALTLGAAAANAEVTAAAPDSFTVRHSIVVPLDANAAYARLARIQDWWDGAHTYGGQAGSLTLAATPGGCWCEQLADGGFVEHMRVIYAQPGKVLRLDGGLGPLQGIGARGVLTYTLKPEGTGTKVTMTYVVIGASGSLEKLAAPVDGVLGEAMLRFGSGAPITR